MPSDFPENPNISRLIAQMTANLIEILVCAQDYHPFVMEEVKVEMHLRCR